MTPRNEPVFALCSGCQKEISVVGPQGHGRYRQHTKVADVPCLGSGQLVPSERLVEVRSGRARPT